MKDCANIFVVARPGRLRESLQVFLASIPQVNCISATDSEMTVLESMPECCPDVVIFDTSIGADGGQALLQNLKRAWPGVRSIALAHDLDHRTSAAAAGANVALLRGFAATELYTTIESLLSATVDPVTNEHQESDNQ